LVSLYYGGSDLGSLIGTTNHLSRGGTKAFGVSRGCMMHEHKKNAVSNRKTQILLGSHPSVSSRP